MSLETISTTRWRKRSTSSPPSASASAAWSRIDADRLLAVHEPLAWTLRLGERVAPERAAAHLRLAARGPADDAWEPPPWLYSHQREAARRVAGIMAVFGGALLADAVGLGKTYVALALALRYRRTVAVVPASLVPQWRRTAARLRVSVQLVSHEQLSRGGQVPDADLLVVDEAHRFRNPETQRHNRLARRPAPAHLLLLTATPVVNRAADLGRLLALFLPDNALAVLGLPSLERAIGARDYAGIARAAASAIVARSPGVVATTDPVPLANDAALLCPPPVPAPDLRPICDLVDALHFPALGDESTASLLRLHLLYRLASSPAACQETVRRHLTYLDRALAAAARGEALSRGAARLLFGVDEDFQLDLGLSDHTRPPLAVEDLGPERQRLEAIVSRLGAGHAPNPKAEALRQILDRRANHKTIVFTASVATAVDLARSLAWRRVAVVSGRGAWIASGRLPLEDALRLFAPRARGAPPPPSAAEATTLIATDLASEGLDLQDADAIVHFDLPWTPLRLQQRLGRIARLGSSHRTVEVFWFTPPAELEARLTLGARIAEKVSCQLGLGVAVSSRVGRARVLGDVLQGRERLAQKAAPPNAAGPCVAIVRGLHASAFAVRWRSGSRSVPELIVFEGHPPRVVLDPARVAGTVETLIAASAAPGSPPLRDLTALRTYVRHRLAGSARGAVGERNRRLTRRILCRASAAARERNHRLLADLDRALSRLAAGVTEGSARALEDALARRHPSGAIRQWLAQHPEPGSEPWLVSLDAAILSVPDNLPPALSSGGEPRHVQRAPHPVPDEGAP